MSEEDPNPHLEAWRAATQSLDARHFSPPRWLRNGHAQTVWTHLFRRTQEQASEAFTVLLEGHEPIQAFADGPRSEGPIILAIPGLEANALGPAVCGLSQAALNHGFSAYRFSHPGTGAGAEGETRRLYHSGDTSSLAAVAHAIAARHPGQPIWLVGISMGGNLAALALSRDWNDMPETVRGGVAISAPFDLCASERRVDRTLGGFYARHFLRSLKVKARARHRLDPASFDLKAALKARTLEDFDEAVTAPLNGFRDAAHYRKSSSSGPWLKGIGHPFLIISAEDDPFHPRNSLPKETIAANPWLAAVLTRRGGHAAFHDGRALDRPSWADECALKAIARFEALTDGLAQQTSANDIEPKSHRITRNASP